MRVIRSHPEDAFSLPHEFIDHCRGVTVGNFDGVHLGHRALIEGLAVKLDVLATRAQRPPCRIVYTFEPHPREVLGKGDSSHQPNLLTPLAVKLDLLRRLGVDLVVVQRFTRTFSQHEPDVFLNRFFLGPLAPSVVVAGYDWSFGKGAQGGLAALQEAGTQYGTDVHVIDAVQRDGAPVGSQRIRSHLRAGEVQAAASLLGRAYCLRGVVVAGDQRGRELGFPTANVRTTKQLIPLYGVYATRVHIEGVDYAAVTNVGVRPTFDGEYPVVESHVFDCDLNLYGKRIDIEFHAFLRTEQRFPSVEALKSAIQADCRAARDFFTNSNE